MEAQGQAISERRRGRPRRLRSIGGRIGFAVATLVISSFLIFSATEALPGDYATAALGRQATPEALAQRRLEVGLDRPFAERYADWALGAIHGDFGTSYSARRSTWELVEPRLRNSLALAFAAILLTIPLGIALGLFTALKSQGWLDGAVGATTLVLVALPEFVLGLFLALIFGVAWQILPATSLFEPSDSAFQHSRELVLPAAAAAGVTLGYIIRMVRVSTLEVLDAPYVLAARLRGTPTRTLLTRHVLRNALIPAVSVIGINVAWMLTGMIAIELIFSFPGLGSLLLQSISSRDAPLIATISLFITLGYIVVNLLSDLVVAVLDPRIGARQA